MSIPPLKSGTITVTHANSNRHNQICMAAEAIWGIKPAKLPQAKFEELKTVLENCLTREYGPYRVQGFGDVFVIDADEKVLEPSYKKSPCSLDSCMVTDAASRCSRCKTAMYCSRDHQKLDWARHRIACVSQL